ncbi:MAG: hypothetical protein JXA98_08420 [Methanosarcinaceae archaeon]|nr:hypothetical protein [Methanosarcinaceae archaeon]
MQGSSTLKTHHRPVDCLYWNFLWLIPLTVACLAIAKYSMHWMVVYVILIFLHFFVLEYRFFCSHCPHYCREGRTTNCMLLYRYPKYFKPRPYPLSKFDIIITSIGFLVIIAYPLYWLIREPFYLGVYFAGLAVFLFTVRRYECPRCIYFSCPFNSVPEEQRREYEKERGD